MKNLIKIILVGIFTSTCVSITFTQPPPPPAASPDSDKEVKKYTPSSLNNADGFSSVDGRFKILLPSQISGFSALTPKQLGFNASGSSYIWKLQEGNILVAFYDSKDNEKIKSEQDHVNFFAGSSEGYAESSKAKILSTKLIKLNQIQGQASFYELPNGVNIIRYTYLDGSRLYDLQGFFNPNVPDSKNLIQKAFDSFEITSQSVIDAEMQKKIKEATPEPLPQEPTAEKFKSDAEDEGLKGKVKKIIEESEDLSGTWSQQGRKISSIEYYNQKGNFIKREHFDYRGNPSQITVYGYIDGKRVSDSKLINYEYNPPPAAIAPSAATKSKPKSDSRYQYERRYKYENGKLVESLLVNNRGEIIGRTIYKYEGNKFETLIYASNGSLNQKYLTILDKDGNVLEKTSYDQTGIYGDRKYSYSYEFDAKGNWIKQITSKEIEENGKKIFKPSSVYYRTITYYE